MQSLLVHSLLLKIVGFNLIYVVTLQLYYFNFRTFLLNVIREKLWFTIIRTFYVYNFIVIFQSEPEKEQLRGLHAQLEKMLQIEWQKIRKLIWNLERCWTNCKIKFLLTYLFEEGRNVKWLKSSLFKFLIEAKKGFWIILIICH